MKLYATVESNRAKKGQGGDYLKIRAQDADRNTFISLDCYPEANGDIRIVGNISGLKSIISTYKKGNKQKGEQKKDNGECAVCDAPLGNDLMCPYGC
jgi:hypothetical protein